jgi:DNA-binding transcriptional LysR family regulator
MSHNLARLRRLFDDELLTRSAEGMRPTPRALALAERVRSALRLVQSTVLESGTFDPATAERVFRIGLADSIEVAIMPAVVERLQALAPGVSLRLRPANRIDVLEELDTGQLDLGVGVFEQGQVHHFRRQLYTDHFLCLFSPEQLGVSAPLSLEEYLRFPHILTSLADDTRGVVDEALAKRKLRRRVIMTTPGFLAVPFVVRRAPVLITMPSRLAHYFADAFSLATSSVPIELPRFTISLLWHGSFNRDLSHMWLRQTIASLVSEDSLEL